MEPAPASPRGAYGRIGLGAAIQFVGVIVQQLLRFSSNWLIARLFGPGVLGLYSLAFTSWSAVEMSFSGGLIRAIMRYVPHHQARDEAPETKGTVGLALATAVVGGGVLALTIFLLADTIAVHVLNKPETAPVLRVLAVLMPLAATSAVVWATARALGSFMFIVYQFMIVPAVFVGGIVLAWVAHGGAPLLAAAYGLSLLLPLVPLWAYHNRLVRSLQALRPRFLARAFLSFAGIGALMWLAEYVARNIDIVLVGRLCPATEVGIYNVATRNATLCSTVMVSINAFFMPTVSSLYSAGRMDEFRTIFRKGTLWILIVGAPLIVYAMAFSQPIMLFFGRNFGGGAWALWILALAQLFNQGTGLVASALSMANRQHSVLVANIIGVLVTVGLCQLLIPRYGLNGAAVAMAGSVVFVNLTLCAWAYLKLRLSPLSPSYFKPLIAAGCSGVVSQLLLRVIPLAPAPQAPRLVDIVLTLLVGMAFFAPLYVLVMWLLGMKEEGLGALRAVRSGLNKRSRAAAE